MPAKSKQMTPEEWRAYQARYARLGESTTAALHAAIDAVKAGGSREEIRAAARAASDKIMRPNATRLHTMPGDLSVETLPRLAAPGWTAEKQRDFLVHLSESGCVSQACEAVGLSRQSAYALRRRAPKSIFALAWDVAIHMARQSMLDEATERAIRGREVPVWYRGEQVGTRTVHNDKLLMFLLSMKRDALHPRLDAREMTHLFPTMLNMVDTVLPSPFSPQRIAELTGEEGDWEDDA